MTLLKNDKSKNITANRIYYLDILRVIACLSVIMIHSSAKYVVEDFGTFNFWVGNILDSLSRIGVPLFVMISGALMLDKNYEYSTKKLIKHIKKMILFFICWSAIYCVIFQIIEQIIIKHESIDMAKIIMSFIQGYYHLWFIYLIIGLYMLIPLLRLWVKDANKKQVEYFIVISIILTYIIPQIISIGSNYSELFKYFKDIIENKLCIKYFDGFTTYFILGWYIHNYDIKNKKIIYILGICGLIITIVGTYILSVSTGKAIQMYGNLTLNVLLQSIMIFLYIKTKFINVKNSKNKFINTVSKKSLGIYAIHVLVINFVYKIISKIGCEIAIINIPTTFFASFLIAFLGTYILSKVQILKKIV